MQRSARRTAAFKKSIGNTTKALIPFNLGLAAIGATSVYFVKRQMANIDALGKTADKLGTTTEALAGYRHAAELSGVASNTADMALQRMTRRLAEAAQGTGEAKAALKELGLDAKRLAGMGPTKAFADIAEKMKGVKNQADRVRLSFKLFDSEGVALVNTLKLGKVGLADAAAEAEKLGIAISRVDAAKVEKANDAFTKMAGAFKGFGNTIVTNFAEPLAKAAKAMESIISLSGDKFWHDFWIKAGLGPKLETFKLEKIQPKPKDAGIRTEFNKLIAKEHRQFRLVSAMNESADEIRRGQSVVTPAEYDAAKQKLRNIRRTLAAEEKRYKALLAIRAPAARRASGAITGAVDAMIGGTGAAAVRSGIGRGVAGMKGMMSHGRQLRHTMIDIGRAVDKAGDAINKRFARNRALEESAKQFEAIRKGLEDATRTPAERFRKTVQKLQGNLMLGVIDPGLFGRGMGAALDQLRAAAGPGPQAATYQRNPAIEAGSQAAYDAIQRAMHGPAATEGKKQTTELRKLNTTQAEARDLLRELGDDAPEPVGIGAG
jgi:hypothetical protein